MTLIGLGHQARQGKGEVAAYWKSLQPKLTVYAFADELKLYCKEHHDELEPLWQLANQTQQKPGWKEDPIYGCTAILQWYGTNVARKADPDVWVKALDTRLSRENPEIAVITDVRFPNEAEYLREKGGFLVKVVRLNKDGTQYVDPQRDPNHASEIALEGYEDWDYVIEVKEDDFRGLKAKAIGVWNLVTDNYIAYPEPEVYTLTTKDFFAQYGDTFGFVDEYEFGDSDGTGFKS